MRSTNINIELKNVNQLLLDPGSLFAGKRMLSPAAEEFIIEEASMNSPTDHFQVKINIHGNETDKKDEIPMAIHQHFSYRRKKSEQELKKVLQLGWQSLLISIVFLGFIITLSLILLKLLPEGGLSMTFRELLIILGWVALWRPADLLLYEWRPLKREINLFHKLETSRVDVVYQNKSGIANL